MLLAGLNLYLMEKQKSNLDQVAAKLRQYCAYQERCLVETREKLNGFGLESNEVEAIIAQLIEGNFLNEERFAIAFAGGKFRSRQWGKIKIRYALRQKQVNDLCINKALAGIAEGDYFEALKKLAGKKLHELRIEKNPYVQRRKLQDYLLAKGYESGLVSEVAKELLK